MIRLVLLFFYLLVEFQIAAFVYRMSGFLGLVVSVVLPLIIGVKLIQLSARRLQQINSQSLSGAERVAVGFLAGLLFIIPGYLSDVAAVFVMVCLPLVAKYFGKQLAKSFQASGEQPAGFHFYWQSFRTAGEPRFESRPAPQRDVTPQVIDVKHTRQ